MTFRKRSDGTRLDIPLLGTEREEGSRAAAGFTAGDPILSEELYDVIFTSIDTAGNTGLDTVSNYTYDITPPEVLVTFSELYASMDQTDTVFATFNEKIAPAPNILIDWNTLSVPPTNVAMSPVAGGDSTKWFREL